MSPKVKLGEPTARHMLRSLLLEAMSYRAVESTDNEGFARIRAFVDRFLAERKDSVEAAFFRERERSKTEGTPYRETAPYETLLPELLKAAPDGMLAHRDPDADLNLVLYPVDPKLHEAHMAARAERLGSEAEDP